MVTSIKGNDTSTFGGAVDLGANNLTTTGNADVGQVITDAPAFSVYLSADQSISASTWNKVAFDSTRFDTDSYWDATNYRYTPQVAGYYQFNSIIRNRADASMSNAFGAFFKNGSEYSRLSGVQIASVGAILGSSGSDLIYLNGSTDYVEVYGWNNGSTNNRIGGSISVTVFSGFLARAV